MALLGACGRSDSDPPAAIAFAPLGSEQAVTPIPNDLRFDPNVVGLGRALFTDPRLSRNGTISCSHCHALDRYGVDGLPRSVGIDGRRGSMNAPTVYNSGFNFRQFWDGRAGSLEEQVDGPLGNPAEMDTDWPTVLAKLNGDSSIQSLARRAFGRPLDAAGARSALAEFERSLTTPDAPFDRYLRGDEQAIDARAREGWRLFSELGCVSCHQGVNVGGNMYARIGEFNDRFTRTAKDASHFGRFNVTGREEDRFTFKVPSLRNVARTAPYFHDGSVATLAEAVDRMALSQLGLKLGDKERDLIVAFLESLTGRPPGAAP
jgi:cytochrome c peroxidase